MSFRHEHSSTSTSSYQKKTNCVLTNKWLEENYCFSEDICVPRGLVYEHYLKFCKASHIVSVCKATFGKIIRNKFPGVTSKRLGARGHSKYHYNGISVRRNNSYLPSLNVTGATRFSGYCSLNKDDKNQSTKEFSLSNKVGTVLPKFPSAEDFRIPPSINADLVFLTMYRIHCQCIVDTTVSGNFEEIRIFLLHFWHGLPDHLLPIVSEDIVRDIIIACDCILYETLTDVLIPRDITTISSKLLRAVRNLGLHWLPWLRKSLENLPQPLRELKETIGRDFGRSLRSHVEFLHICEVASSLLSDDVVLRPFFVELIENISSFSRNCDCSSIFNNEEAMKHERNCNLMWCETMMEDLVHQLQPKPTLEFLVYCMDIVVTKHVVKNSIYEASVDEGKQKVLQLNRMLQNIALRLSIEESKHFVSYHIFSLFINDYLLLTIENQSNYLKVKEIYSKLKNHLILHDEADKSLRKRKVSQRINNQEYVSSIQQDPFHGKDDDNKFNIRRWMKQPTRNAPSYQKETDNKKRARIRRKKRQRTNINFSQESHYEQYYEYPPCEYQDFSATLQSSAFETCSPSSFVAQISAIPDSDCNRHINQQLVPYITSQSWFDYHGMTSVSSIESDAYGDSNIIQH